MLKETNTSWKETLHLALKLSQLRVAQQEWEMKVDVGLQWCPLYLLSIDIMYWWILLQGLMVVRIGYSFTSPLWSSEPLSDICPNHREVLRFLLVLDRFYWSICWLMPSYAYFMYASFLSMHNRVFHVTESESPCFHTRFAIRKNHKCQVQSKPDQYVMYPLII